jgi:hypothetical protein
MPRTIRDLDPVPLMTKPVKRMPCPTELDRETEARVERLMIRPGLEVLTMARFAVELVVLPEAFVTTQA